MISRIKKRENILLFNGIMLFLASDIYLQLCCVCVCFFFFNSFTCELFSSRNGNGYDCGCPLCQYVLHKIPLTGYDLTFSWEPWSVWFSLGECLYLLWQREQYELMVAVCLSLFYLSLSVGLSCYISVLWVEIFTTKVLFELLDSSRSSWRHTIHRVRKRWRARKPLQPTDCP